MGPYFNPSAEGKAGCQIDLLFDRADNVLTLCEMKYSRQPVGVEAIAEVEKKVRFLETVAGRKTIQPVLVMRGKPSGELVNRVYFYRILEVGELLAER